MNKVLKVPKRRNKFKIPSLFRKAGKHINKKRKQLKDNYYE
jgi:hypothetical protein